MTRSLTRLSLTGKLFLVGAVVVIGFGTFNYLAHQTLQVVKVHGPYYQSIVQSKDLIADILPPPEYIIESYLVAFQMTSGNDPNELAGLIERSAALEKDYRNRHEFWQQELTDGELKTRFLADSCKPALEFYKTVNDRLIPAVKRGDREAARCLLAGELNDNYRAHRAAIDDVVTLATQRNLRDEQEARQITRLRMALMIGIGVLTCLGLVVCLMVVGRSITRPIHRIIAGLDEGANQMNGAAAQVSSASRQLAEGASAQACNLEETSRALEEMAGMARQNAQNSHQANEFMAEAGTVIAEADGAMKETSKAMAQISEASDKIRRIIKVIEEIAFQTNLLALNAAVEAARAGEHGAGFAVVAQEVRNLAQRAAQASRETAELIEQTLARVGRGVELNQTTSDNFVKIGKVTNKVAELVAQISQASAKQAQGVSQVNTAVAQMDKVIQETATEANESSSASQELSAQAQAVKGMVETLVTVVGRNAGGSVDRNQSRPRQPTRGADGCIGFPHCPT